MSKGGECGAVASGDAVPKPDLSVFNVKFFRTFTLGAPELEAEIIGLFLTDLPVVKARIMAALDTDDWLGAVHRLRGSALGIGAERLADAARQAEHLAIDDDANRLRALADMADEIVALKAELLARGFEAVP